MPETPSRTALPQSGVQNFSAHSSFDIEGPSFHYVKPLRADRLFCYRTTCLEESRSTDTETPTKKCLGTNTTQRHCLSEKFFIIAPRPNCQCSHSSLGSIRLVSLPSFGVQIVTISPRL